MYILPNPSLVSSLNSQSSKQTQKLFPSAGLSPNPLFGSETSDQFKLAYRSHLPNTLKASILDAPAVRINSIPDAWGSIPLTLQGLWQQIVFQQNQPENPMLYIDSRMMPDVDSYSFWLANTLPLLDKPVDIVVDSPISRAGLAMLLSTSGKTFIKPAATLSLEPVLTAMQGQQPGSNIQTRKRLATHLLNNLATLVMAQSGETDRKKVFRDLKVFKEARELNSLQLLHYGKKGLINGGILVDTHPDRVVTRQAMDSYFEREKFTPQQIEEFLKDYHNVFKIPAQELPANSNTAIKSRYTPMNPDYAEKATNPNPHPILYKPDQKKSAVQEHYVAHDTIPSQLQIDEQDPTTGSSYALSIPQQYSKSILNNDAIFYADAVKPEQMAKLCER